MAGSLNSSDFKCESKFCAKCGQAFFRPKKFSKKQWEARDHCSKRCASTKRNPEDDEKIAAMYSSGMSCYEIATLFSTSATNINRILHKNNVEVNPYRVKKGGISITKDGYLRFNPTGSNGVNAGRRLHDIVAEMKIGRPLGKNEVVHHMDWNKMNNHPDNLVVMTRGEHTTLHKKRETGC